MKLLIYEELNGEPSVSSNEGGERGRHCPLAHRAGRDRAAKAMARLIRDPIRDWDQHSLGFAMRATVHTTTRAMPSQLVFNRDAIWNIPFEADWLKIKNCKTKLIQKNNKWENAKRIDHTYNVGDKVLVEQNPNRKFREDQYKGPFEIVQVYNNGTIRLKKSNAHGGAIYKTWNIQNIVPYQA
jgi:hypothetical protein